MNVKELIKHIESFPSGHIFNHTINSLSVDGRVSNHPILSIGFGYKQSREKALEKLNESLNKRHYYSVTKYYDCYTTIDTKEYIRILRFNECVYLTYENDYNLECIETICKELDIKTLSPKYKRKTSTTPREVILDGEIEKIILLNTFK